jgi:PAS domain S-box-containing protein
MIGTHQDITERRRADEKLRQSVERHQSLFGRMLDGMYRSTHEGRFVDVNTAFVKMFGFTSKQEMLDITDIKKELYFSPEERGSHLLDTGQEEVEAYRMRRKDGSEIWVEDHGHYVHDKQGNIIYHEGILRDITERRLIEQRLRFRGEIVENISEGVAGIRVSDGVIVYTNPRFEEMLGYGLGELIGKNIATVNAPDNGKRPAEIAAGIIRRLGESRRWSGEIQNIKKDGTPIWCRASVSTLESSEYGRIWVATHEDITQRKQMEETLSRRAEELQALQATVLDITRQQDLPTLLNAIVERAAGLFGAPSGGMYLCDTDRQEARCVISYNTRIDTVGTVLKYGEGAAGTVAQTGKPLIIEDYRTWTGRAAAYEKDQPFSAVLSAPMIWQSQVIGVIHVLDDNEERHFTESDLRLLELFANHAAIAIENDRHSENLEHMVAERTSKLADSQHQLQLMADSLPALISYIDPQQRYRFNNKAYEEWFGQSPNEILGRPVREVLGENGYERTHGRMEAALSGARQSFEYELTSKSGTRQISATYIPDFGEQGEVKGVFVLGIDITERKRMEERLLKAERLAAIGETAAMVGHDLRNPLQAISVAAYVLEKRLGPEADMQTREMLESVKNSVSYSDRIVEDLLEYSEETRLELSETTPKTIALEALLNVRIPDNISVSNLTSDEPKIRIDPVKIRRLFLNLIENAVDSMPDGGKLTIISNKSNNYVELKFIDTGVGVSEHVLRELWKPFITTKPKGMGLGLAICKRITEAHGGSISLDTRKGEGTTFTVRLPLTANHEGDKNA